MYRAENCLACGSTNLLARPGFLTRMIVWRSTNIDPGSDIENHALICLDCSFEFSEMRLTEQEETLYYTGYRNELYNEQRKICTPFYEKIKQIFNQPWYIKNRKNAVTSLVKKSVNPQSITKVLDYGGDDGSLIANCFTNANTYVYDLSGRSLVEKVQRFNFNDLTKFDLIVCSHVLEHKSNPSDLIEELKHFMNHDSYLYLEVPYKESYPLPPNTFDEHLNVWNEQSIKSFLEKHDIEILNMSIYDIMINSNTDFALKLLCKLQGVT